MNQSSRIQTLKDIFREELKESKNVAYLLFLSNCDSTIDTEETPTGSPETGQEGSTVTTWSSALSQVRKGSLKKH